MSINLLFAQMPLVSQIAAAEMAHPEVQQVLAQHAAAEAMLKNGEQIQKTEKEEPAEPIRAGSHQGRRRGHPGEREEKKRDTKDDEGAEPETQAASTTIWAGNILNVKV